MALGILGKKGLTAHYFFCFSVSEGVTIGSALSPSLSSSFTRALGIGRTASESSSPRSSDASMTRKNKLWPFSKKVLEGDPAMILVQLDVKRGNVNDIVNDSIKSSYQVSDVIDMKEDELNPTILTIVLSEERGHVYQFQTTHDLAVFRLTLLEVSAGMWTMIRFPRTVLRKGNIKKQGKTGIYFERFAVIVPQKLFIMKSRNSFFPANTVCLTDAVSDYDDVQNTVHLQAGGREFHFKGMSQQDAKGWSQALSTACVLQYKAQPFSEETLIQEQQKAEDMLQAASAGIAPTTTTAASNDEAAAAATSGVGDSFSTDAAYLSKVQVLRELGFLPETSAGEQAFLQPQLPAASSEQDADPTTAGVQRPLPGLDVAEGHQGSNKGLRVEMSGASAQDADAAGLDGYLGQQASSTDVVAAASKTKAPQRSPEDRAALARSKGWAPRPLQQPKLQPTAGITLADSTPTSAAAAVSGGTQSGAAAVQPMPWQNLGLRFTTAPVVDDEDMMSDAQAENVHAHNQLAESADQEEQSALQAAITAMPTPDRQDLETLTTAAQLIGQAFPSEDDLLDASLGDCNQSEWEARADFTRRLSLYPRDSFQDLEMGNGAQSEWEARAFWSLDSYGAPGEVLLLTSASGLPGTDLLSTSLDLVHSSPDQLGLHPVTATDQDGTEFQPAQQTKLTDMHDPLGESESAVQQPLSAKAAAAAALQRALSNIQFIATGSQKTRAAAAAALAAEADAANNVAAQDHSDPDTASSAGIYTAGSVLPEAAAVDYSRVVGSSSGTDHTDVGVGSVSAFAATLYSSSLMGDTQASLVRASVASHSAALQSVYDPNFQLQESGTTTAAPVEAVAGVTPSDVVGSLCPVAEVQLDSGHHQVQTAPALPQDLIEEDSSLSMAANAQQASDSPQLQSTSVSQLDLLSGLLTADPACGVQPVSAELQLDPQSTWGQQLLATPLPQQPLQLEPVASAPQQSANGNMQLPAGSPLPQPNSPDISTPQQSVSEDVQIPAGSPQPQLASPDTSTSQLHAADAMVHGTASWLAQEASLPSLHAGSLKAALRMPDGDVAVLSSGSVAAAADMVGGQWPNLAGHWQQPLPESAADVSDTTPMQGSRAPNGWIQPAASSIATADKLLLTASARQHTWHPDTSNVSRLLVRSTVQAGCEADKSRLQSSATVTRRFTEQQQLTYLREGSHRRVADAASMGTPQSSLVQPQGGLHWPQMSAEQPQGHLRAPQGTPAQMPQSSLVQPSHSFTQLQGMQSKMPHAWCESEDRWHQPGKHAALVSDSGQAHAKLTDAWGDSGILAQAGKHSVQALKVRSFTSGVESPPSLQVYSLAADQSNPALFNSMAGSNSIAVAPDRQERGRSSFLISTRYSAQSSADLTHGRGASDFLLARSSLQEGLAELQDDTQQQQRGLSGSQNSGLYSAISVQPRRLRPSLLAPPTTLGNVLESHHAAAAQEDRPRARAPDRQSPVAAALADSPWDDRVDPLRHQGSWHLPTPAQSHRGWQQQQQRQQPLEESWNERVAQQVSQSLQLQPRHSQPMWSTELESGNDAQHAARAEAESEVPANILLEAYQGQHDVGRAPDTCSLPGESFDMGDMPALQTTEAAPHEGEANLQPQAQTSLPFCQEASQLSGDAEQHANNAFSPPCSSAHMLQHGEASAGQGLTAVRQQLEPGGGVVSSQNIWEEAGRHQITASTSTNGFGSSQASAADQEVFSESVPAASSKSGQPASVVQSAPYRPQSRAGGPLPVDSQSCTAEAATLSAASYSAAKLAQRQAQTPSAATAPPPPPPQLRSYLAVKPPGLPPPSQACLTAAVAAASEVAQATVAAGSMPVPSTLAASSLQDSRAASVPGSIREAPLATAGKAGRIKKAPVATAALPAAGAEPPAAVGVEAAAEGILSGVTATAGAPQPPSDLPTAATGRTASAALVSAPPGLDEYAPAPASLSPLPVLVDPIGTTLSKNALASPETAADPEPTAAAATGGSPGGTGSVESLAVELSNATARALSATAALSAAVHQCGYTGQVKGQDLLYEYLAPVLATVPATQDRRLTFLPPHRPGPSPDHLGSTDPQTMPHSIQAVQTSSGHHCQQQQHGETQSHLPSRHHPLSPLSLRIGLKVCDDAQDFLLPCRSGIGTTNLVQQPDTAYAADRQTSVCVQKQAEVTGDSRSTREVLCPDGDSTCVRHATRAEAAAQGMASSSDEPANVDGLPRAYGRHVTGSVVAIATTGCRSDPPAASAVLTHSPSAGLPSPHMPVLAPTPEQTSDAGQQQTLTDITGLPAIPQQDASATDATVDSATAPRSDAVNGEAVSLAGAVPASPVHMACAWQSAATGQQETPAKAAGADSQGRPVSALTQAVPGLPGVSAEEVQQLLELMKSMQAAGAWPHGAPAVAEHGAHERALPAERMSDAMSVNSAVAHHMPDAASGSPAVAHHMPDAVLESPAVAHHMQALHMQPHEASGQLQVAAAMSPSATSAASVAVTSCPLKARQARESSCCSSADQCGLQKLATTAPPTPSASQQAPDSTHANQAHTCLDADTSGYAGVAGLRLCRQAGHMHRTAAGRYAGHAELLRLKRHWRPISRQLQLSDSDDSDGLSDFDSIDDFHTEAGTAHLQPEQQAAKHCTNSEHKGGNLAVGTAVNAGLQQPAVSLQPAEWEGRTGTALHVENFVMGSSMHLPLLPGIQVHVSMAPHDGPSHCRLQSQQPHWHHDGQPHGHHDGHHHGQPHGHHDGQPHWHHDGHASQPRPDEGAANGGGEPGKGSEPDGEESQQGRQAHGKGSGHVRSPPKPGLAEGVRTKQQGGKYDYQRKLTQQLSQLSIPSDTAESHYSTQDTLTDASQSSTGSQARSYSSSSSSAPERSQGKDYINTPEPESPRPCPGPTHGRRGQAEPQQRHLHGQQRGQVSTWHDQQKWRDTGAFLGSSRKLAALAKSTARMHRESGSCPDEQRVRKHSMAPGTEKREGLGSAAAQQANHVEQTPTCAGRTADGQQHRAKHPSLSSVLSPAQGASHSDQRRTECGSIHLGRDNRVAQARGQRRHQQQASASQYQTRHLYMAGDDSKQRSDSSLESCHARKQPVTSPNQAHVHKRMSRSHAAAAAESGHDSHPSGGHGKSNRVRSVESAQRQMECQRLLYQSAGEQRHPARQSTSTRAARQSMAASLPVESGANEQPSRQTQQQQSGQPSKHTGLQQTASESRPHTAEAVSEALVADVPVGTGLHCTALGAGAPAINGPGLHGFAAMPSAQTVPAVRGLAATVPHAVLHGAAPMAGQQEAVTDPVQALMIALESMTKASQDKLAAVGQTDQQMPVPAAAVAATAAAAHAGVTLTLGLSRAEQAGLEPHHSTRDPGLYGSTSVRHMAPTWATHGYPYSTRPGLGLEEEEEQEEVALSPQASRRITTIASSVADQVDRAVSAAVQAISPGRLPMSMTSPAYGQEVTEASHTALMRNRLLQQMQAPSDADLHHLGSRYSPTTSQAAPKQRCDSRCLQPPLRGSGHHHYLPSAGDGASPRMRHRSQVKGWEAADDHVAEGNSMSDRRCASDASGCDMAGVDYNSAHQQQSKRARLEQRNSNCVEAGANGQSISRTQHTDQHQGADMKLDGAQGPVLDAATMQQRGQHFHWMPVFCQMGGAGGYPGGLQGSPGSAWGQGMPNVPLLNNGPQGNFQASGAGPSSPASQWQPSMSFPNGSQPYPYPVMGPNPSMPTVSLPQTSTEADSGERQLAQAPAGNAADAGCSSAQAVAVSSQQQQSSITERGGMDQKAGNSSAVSHGQSSKLTDSRVIQAVASVTARPAAVAACLPKLEKQLSNRSSEDLTARAVAKLWGVNLKRYTGRIN